MDGPPGQGPDTPSARSDYDDEEKTVSTLEGESAIQDEESGGDKEVVDAPPPIIINQYSEEDIQSLINKVKRCTTLYDLLEEDWNDDVCSVIRNYFELPGTEVLSVYFNDTKLEATLSIATSPIRDLTYFIKDADDIITVENFHDTVMFGTVDTTVEGSLLAVLENVYAPVFFNATTWPDSVKSDFCSQMHSFLGNLTDLRHKMLAITVIYVPKEGLNVDVDEAQHDKELIKRLEGVVVHWMKQIRVALGDKDQSTINELLCPKDEFSFWVYRYENLRGLQYQLENKDLKHICNILNASQSAYISNFYQLQDEIKETLAEAKSNVEYLNLLMDPCNQLEEVQLVSEIPEHIPDILSLFRVIWNNSPYYNTTSRLTVLCRALSNQIILQCVSTVDLDNILHNGSTHSGIQFLNSCITCCEHYKLLYDKIARAHLRYTNKSWDLDRPTIFNHVDSFVQRCRDMIDVCEAMIVFGRVDETEDIAKPQFFGTRGPEFEKICDKIEQNFFSALQEIKDVQHTILDVQASSWYDSIFRFRKRVRDIEIIIDNLVAAAFENVKNVEEGIDVLWATYQYAKRPNLKDLFEKKTYEVYNSFNSAMLKVKTLLVADKEKHPIVMPSYAGRAMMAVMKKRELSKIINKFDEAEWMLLSGKGDEVRSHHKNLSESVEVYVRNLHRQWLLSLDDDVSQLLNRKLLVHSTSKPGLLEPNFDRRVQQVVQEALYWSDMNMSIPTAVQNIANRWKSLSFLYESVVTVALDYNRIISSLSDEERLLFRELIKGCDKKIGPGLQRYNWDTDIADVYILECLNFTCMVQDIIDDYKSSVQEIVILCEQICDSPLINIPQTKEYELKDLESLMYDFRKRMTIKIVQHYKDIIDYLWFLCEKFDDHLNDMMDHWARFISKIDVLVEESLRLCFKNSLQVMYEVLHGDGTTGPTPLIILRTDLVNNQITFEPTLVEVGTMISRVLKSFLDSLKGVPRLWERFNTKVVHPSFYEVIECDEECKKLQTNLNQEMAKNIELIKTHLTQWEPFRDTWEVNKDAFIARFEKLITTVASFESDMARYGEVSNKVQMLETISPVHFLTVNSSALKKAISEHCSQWTHKFCELLMKLATQKINHIYEYTTDNGFRINQEPRNLKELQESLSLYSQLVSEVPEKEKDFPLIADQMAVLRKYEVEISEDMQEAEQGLNQRWLWYLDLLKSGEEMLATSKVKLSRRKTLPFQAFMLE